MAGNHSIFTIIFGRRVEEEVGVSIVEKQSGMW